MLRTFSPPSRRTAGFSLVDVMGAVLVIGIAVTGLVVANGRAMSMLKSSKQAAVASKCLQQRIEQVRNYNWTQVTDATALQDLYATPPLPSIELPGFAEQITVSGITLPTSGGAVAAPVSPFVQVTRSTAGVVALASDNATLTEGTLVRVDVQITWPGPGGSTRMRETSVVIGNGGLGR